MDENRKTTRKKRIRTLLFILIQAAVIAFTALREFSGNKAGTMTSGFSKDAWIYGIFTGGCLLVLLLAETLKYVLMMHSLKAPVSFRIAAETAILGKYYDCITPSGAGGQPFQILWMRRHGYSDGEASAMTVGAYVTMQAGFILLTLFFFIFGRTAVPDGLRYTAYPGLLLISLIPCLLVLFSFMPRTVRKLISAVIRLGAKLKIVKDPEKATAKTVEALNSYHTHFSIIARDRLTLACLLLLSLIFRIALCSMPFFVLKMFGADVQYLSVLTSTVYIYAAISLIPTPGNAGAAEGAFYLVFSSVGNDGVFWAMLVWRLFSYWSFILAGAAVYGLNALERRIGKGDAKA